LINFPFPVFHLAVGWSFLDTSAVPGIRYNYRFVFADSSSPVETGLVTFEYAHPRFPNMQFLQMMPGEHSARMQWELSAASTPDFFDVYRKQSGNAGDFQKIDASKGFWNAAHGDSVIFLTLDTTLMPGITYDYFIVAKDMLGNAGNHSDTVRLKAGGRQNVPAVYNFHTWSDSTGIKLTWATPANRSGLQNIMILRSAAYDTGYNLISLAPPNDTTYTDKNVQPGQRYFYQLIVQGAFNYSLPTARVSGMYTGWNDILPVTDLEASSTGKGIKLSWHYPDQKNIQGFKVFRSSSSPHELQLVSGLISPASDSTATVYIDTTAAHAETSFYYAVAPVSKASRQGPFSNTTTGSAWATSKLPAPTGLRFIWLNDTVVSLTWHDMQRETPGVSAYKVYKLSKASDTSSSDIPRLCQTNEFTDTLREGEARWYSVRSFNAANFVSAPSSPVHIEAKINKPLPPGAVHAYLQGNKIVLQWGGSINAPIKEYQIYRAKNTGTISLLKTVNATAKNAYSYTDDTITGNSIYYYYITSTNTHGSESHRSEEISIRTP
jgi:fibronectin type 3 domain-containing protein